MKWLVAALALVAGCGSASKSSATALREAELATRAVNRALGVSTAFVAAGNVNVGATPAIIASALENRVQSEAGSCVSTTKTDNQLHADFGAGCALATAMMHAGGTIDLSVATAANAGVTIDGTLALTVDGGSKLSGDFTIATATGDAFSYAGALTLDGTTVMLPLVQAGIGAGGATVDARNATVGADTLLLTAVHQRFAGCYPDDGVAAVGAVAVTFANGTPQSGQVTLSTGGTASLPTRAGCPPPERLWLRRRGALAPVVVLEAHDVVELRRRHLDHVGVLERDHAVTEQRRHVERLARLEDRRLRRLALAIMHKLHFAVQYHDRFVFLVMVLQRQRMAFLDMQDLADVAIGDRPNQLVSPGLVDDFGLAHRNIHRISFSVCL